MDYKQIYEKIVGIDRYIRLVTICDRNGKIMYSGHREGVKNLLTEDESMRSHVFLTPYNKEVLVRQKIVK